MSNGDGSAVRSYHDRTKHSPASVRASRHALDWANQPLAFKIYETLEPIALPRELPPIDVPALEAIARVESSTANECVPDLPTLTQLLYYSAGITRRITHPGGEIYYRAAACTGALYHIDLYLVCGDLPALAAGVYHFGPQDRALRRLRPGDHRRTLIEATGDEAATAAAPVILVCASTYWRNAWKYQARAYRHCFWDAGTLLANLLAVAAARTVPARVVAGFVDDAVDRLLSLDPVREGVTAIVALGNMPAQAKGSSTAVAPLEFETAPLSKTEIDYPAIRAMHEASSLESKEEVADWRAMINSSIRAKSQSTTSNERLIALRPLSDAEIPRDTIEEVIQRRGSTREFSRESITFERFSTMLDRATRAIPFDFLHPEEPPINDLYLIVHAVDDLSPGAYVFHRESNSLELLKEGDFRRDAGYLGLGQEIPADCSVDVFFLVDLNRVLERFGNRGYRAAQLEASVIGGKLYLAAYAQRLGASGLTFFDDDVTEFFSPHATGKSVMFLLALGRSVKRKL